MKWLVPRALSTVLIPVVLMNVAGQAIAQDGPVSQGPDYEVVYKALRTAERVNPDEARVLVANLVELGNVRVGHRHPAYVVKIQRIYDAAEKILLAQHDTALPEPVGREVRRLRLKMFEIAASRRCDLDDRLVEIERKNGDQATSLQALKALAVDVDRRARGLGPDGCNFVADGPKGFIHLDSTKESDVFMFGCKLGSTPLKASVPAGCLSLQLRPKDLGPPADVEVTVAAEKSATKFKYHFPESP